MADIVSVRIQMGVDNPVRFIKKLPQDLTVDDLRRVVRMDQGIDSSDGVVLIWNGQRLKHPDATLVDLGICNDSMVICIISKEKGRNIEQLVSDEEEEKYREDGVQPVLECHFKNRPFGFAVWANEKAENAIVTKVAGQNAIQLGIKIGYCVYKVNDRVVLNQTHKDVLQCLKNTGCPLRVTFIDLGREYNITFHAKPLGFTVVQDKEENNAKVSKVNSKANAREGLKVGSYITAVNDRRVYGLKHGEIINFINRARFPLQLTFRQPPKLLAVFRKKKMPGSKKNSEKSKKRIFQWLTR